MPKPGGARTRTSAAGSRCAPARGKLPPRRGVPERSTDLDPSAFRTLIEALTDPTILLDTRGTILLANGAFCAYVGKAAGDVIGRSSLSFLPPAQATNRARLMRRVARDRKTLVSEATQGGHTFLTAVHPVPGPGGKVERILVLHRDVTPLRQAQARVEASEARYRHIVEAAIDGLATLEGATISYINPRLEEISGYPAREIVGQEAVKFIHPAERSKVQAQLLLRKGNPAYRAKYETILRAKDGRDIFVEINSSALTFPPEANATLALIRDITERRWAETALREAEDRYRRLIDSSVVGIYITQDGRVQFCNRTFARIFGYESPESMAGQSIKDLVAPESRDLVLAQTRLRETGRVETVNYEFRALRRDGTPIDVEVFGSRFEYRGRPAIQGTMIDITERKRAARELAESNSRLETLLQAIPDIVYFKDAEGRNLIVNKAYERALGVPSERVLGRTDAEILPADLAEQCRLSDDVVRRDLKPVRFEEMRRAEGREGVHYETLKAPIVDDRGALAGLVGVSRDVSEQKRGEKIRSSILSIAQAAISAGSLESFYEAIHHTISGLMPARNLYIAILDDDTGLLHFPYFVDEHDPAPGPKPPGKGLTEYVLRTRRPLLATPEVFARLEAEGEVESIGSPSIDWLGVPLTLGARTFGVLVVQSYTEGVRYGEVERDILRFVSGQVAMAFQRRQADQNLLEREQFLSGVLDSIQDGISILDPDLRIVRVNKTMEGWHAAQMPLVGKKCYQAYHGRSEPCSACPTRRTLQDGRAAREVIRRAGPNGRGGSWLDLYSFPFIDQKTGQMKGVIEYVRDITPQKEAEDRLQASLLEKEVLLREIHHRVKNNLQVIQALISLQSRRLKDAQAVDMYRESQRRIRSMALVHERLYQSTNLSRIDFADYARSLVIHLFHSLLPDGRPVELKFDLEPVALDVNTAIPCGLILSELVSNALKHAFPEGRTGEIRVSLHRGPGPVVRLGVRDDGVGLPPGFDLGLSDSLGMQIVVTLVSQIEGRLRIGQERGSDFEVEFPESVDKQAGAHE
jgi:PAS domain S-box-containing protein